MLEEVVLRNLRYTDYWKQSYKQWGEVSWTNFIRKNIPNISPRLSHTYLSAELKILINNLKPGTRELEKANSFLYRIEVSVLKHVLIKWNF